MKNLFFFLAITLFLIGCGESKTKPESIIEDENTAIDSNYCICSELIFDEPYNHFYRFEKREGFTGYCEEFYLDGKLKMTKNFVDGKLHGKMILYYDNGQIEEEKQFDMNFQTGEQITYTRKGEVKFHALYERGKQVKVLVSKPDLPKVDEWEN